jgi:hypothetical protein
MLSFSSAGGMHALETLIAVPKVTVLTSKISKIPIIAVVLTELFLRRRDYLTPVMVSILGQLVNMQFAVGALQATTLVAFEGCFRLLPLARKFLGTVLYRRPRFCTAS